MRGPLPRLPSCSSDQHSDRKRSDHISIRGAGARTGLDRCRLGSVRNDECSIGLGVALRERRCATRLPHPERAEEAGHAVPRAADYFVLPSNFNWAPGDPQPKQKTLLPELFV